MRAHSALTSIATVALILAIGTISGWIPLPHVSVFFLLALTVFLAVVLFFLTAYRMLTGVTADESAA